MQLIVVIDYIVNTASVLPPQISMNAKLLRVTPTRTAPTHQVHIPATVSVVIREMALTVKVKLNISIYSSNEPGK